MDINALAVAGATGLALYAGHHVGDYWVQTDHQAQHKGDAGIDGALQCLLHVVTYVATQAVMMGLLSLATGWEVSPWLWPALAVSGVTHYLADRREYGLMFKLARLLPGKARFMELGVPRNLHTLGDVDNGRGRFEPGSIVPLDNPSLGTGTWALDQSWHILWGVFVPALILAAAS